MVKLPNDTSLNLQDIRQPSDDDITSSLLYSGTNAMDRKVSGATPEVAVQSTHRVPSAATYRGNTNVSNGIIFGGSDPEMYDVNSILDSMKKKSGY